MFRFPGIFGGRQRCRRAIILAGVAVLSLISAGRANPAVADDEAPADPAQLEKPVKDFSLEDVVSEKVVKLSELKGKVVVLMWHSPGCMTSPRYEERVKKFAADYAEKKVVVLGINSSTGDDVDSLRGYAKAQKFNFPLLRDDGAAVAKYFGIEQTGMFVIIDEKGTLRYQGGFDDNPDADLVKRKYVKDAVDAILAGKKFLLRKSVSFG